MKRFIVVTALVIAPFAMADHHKPGHHTKFNKQATQADQSAAAKPDIERAKAKRSAGASIEQNKGHGNAQPRKERAELAQARNTERKAAKSAYKEEVAAGGDRVKGKKPWWKLWGD